MNWVVRFFADFFMAVGFIVFVGLIIVIYAFGTCALLLRNVYWAFSDRVGRPNRERE